MLMYLKMTTIELIIHRCCAFGVFHDGGDFFIKLRVYLFLEWDCNQFALFVNQSNVSFFLFTRVTQMTILRRNIIFK